MIVDEVKYYGMVSVMYGVFITIKFYINIKF